MQCVYLLALFLCLGRCVAQEEEKKAGTEIVRVDRIKKGPLVTLPIPFSESDKLVAPPNDTLGTILDCQIQNRISDPDAANEGYSFLRCTQLFAYVELLLPPEEKVVVAPKLPGEEGDGTGNQYGDSQHGPQYGASKSGPQNCRDLIFNNLDMDEIRYQIQERGIKVVILNFGDPESNQTSHMVWTLNYGAEYLLEQSMWYRLFSLAPMSMSVSEFNLFSNDTGELDQEILDRCADYIYLPDVPDEDRLEALVHHESTLAHELSLMLGANLSLKLRHNSAVCARVSDDDNETSTGHFRADACHLDYVCCRQRNMEDCHEVKAMPCLLCFYKILIYVIWWLVAVPVFLVLPFHAAYERCDTNGHHDRKHGEYYKINSTSSMLFTLVCESIATKFVVYIMILLLIFYQIWAEFGRFDNWLDIPWWVYAFLLATLAVVPLLKIFWDLWGKDIDAELHRPSKFANRIVNDTFWGAVELPEKCQFRETLVPIRSGIRLHILYRLRLLLQDSYWVFIARDLPRRCCRNKICGIILAPITIILGILNALPAIYLLGSLINAAKNRKKLNYMKKRWLGFLISLIILIPILGAASYTVLCILYHSTSIVILDLNTLPVIALYAFLLDYVWHNLRNINFLYLEIIAFLIEEHQKVVKSMHKGKLGVTQHSDVYDNSDIPVAGVKRRPKQNTVYNRSFRDTMRRESNMAALRTETAMAKKTDDERSEKRSKKPKMYTLEFEDHSSRASGAKSPRSSSGSPLIKGGTVASYWVPAPNTLHLLLHYHGHVLYINREFHRELLATLLPPSVCAFKLVCNIFLLGFGYAILDEFFRCYAPFVPCCLYILFFLVLALSRILLAIQQFAYRFPQDLKVQVRALVENFYTKLYVDPDETGRLDLVLPNVDSTEITDIESVTTADDVPLWPGRISFKDDPGYDADHNGSVRSKEPNKRPAARRNPLPYEPTYSTVPKKQDRITPTQTAPTRTVPLKLEPQRPIVKPQPKKPEPKPKEPETQVVPKHVVTPKPVHTQPKPKVPVAEPEDDEPRRQPRREVPVQSHSLPRVASPPRSQPPQSSTLPRNDPPTKNTKFTIEYVPLIDRPNPNQRPRSMADPTKPGPEDYPDGHPQPRTTSPPTTKSTSPPPKVSFPQQTSPTSPGQPTRNPQRPQSMSPDPWNRDPRRPNPNQNPNLPGSHTTTTIYVRVPRRPHPKPAMPLEYREVQSEPEIPFCDEETSEDDFSPYPENRRPIGSPSSQPVEHSTTYSILPALQEEPDVPVRMATLKRALKDRHSQPEAVPMFLPDGGYHTLQHPPPGYRRSAGPAYYRYSGPNQQQLSRSYEELLK